MPSSSDDHVRFAAGLSAHPDTARATADACRQCSESLGSGGADVALVFFSAHHIERADELVAGVRSAIGPRHIVGVSSEGVLAGRTELERVPGVSVLGARLPGATVHPFSLDSLLPVDDSPEGLSRASEVIGAGDDLRVTVVFADPSSVPTVKLLPALNRARVESSQHGPHGVIVGGMASASNVSGGNLLILDDLRTRSGAVGVSIRGGVRADAVVSQGCRPVGSTFLVTKAKGNVIFELGGRRALDVIQETLAALEEGERNLLRGGLFMGRVINEYKDRFGRDDFLIRGVLGADQASGGVAVGDLMRVGQTVCLHLRDAKSANEDLSLLMDAQNLRGEPAGCLLITCNARGRRLFKRSHHDAMMVAEAFVPPESGESRSKIGELIDPDAPVLPLAGFFAAGEIGPVGGESFLHGHSACVTMFRRDESSA